LVHSLRLLQGGHQNPGRISEPDRVASAQPLAIRTALYWEIGLQVADLPAITPIWTGWALHPNCKKIQEVLLAHNETLTRVMKAEAITTPETWYSCVVNDASKTIYSLVKGERTDTKDLIDEEV